MRGWKSFRERFGPSPSSAWEMPSLGGMLAFSLTVFWNFRAKTSICNACFLCTYAEGEPTFDIFRLLLPLSLHLWAIWTVSSCLSPLPLLLLSFLTASLYHFPLGWCLISWLKLGSSPSVSFLNKKTGGPSNQMLFHLHYCLLLLTWGPFSWGYTVPMYSIREGKTH